MTEKSSSHETPQAAVEHVLSQLRSNQEEAAQLDGVWGRHVRVYRRASWAVTGAVGVAMVVDVVGYHQDWQQLAWAPIAVAGLCAAEGQRRSSEISRVKLAVRQNALQESVLKAALAYNIMAGAAVSIGGVSGEELLSLCVVQVPEAQRPELLYGYTPAPGEQGPAVPGPTAE